MARHSAFNKQQALAEALDLFWSRGFASSSLKHLEEVTDMHPGSLYYHFNSKEQLYLAALQHYLEWFLRPRIDKYLMYSSSLESIRRFFTAGYRHGEELKFRNSCFMVTTITELHLLPESAAQLVQSGLDELHRGFRVYLEKAVTDNKLAPDTQPEFIATELLNLYLSIQLLTRVAPNQHKLDKQVKQTLGNLLNTGDR